MQLSGERGWFFKILKFEFNLAGLLEGTSEPQTRGFGSCTGSLVGQLF